MPRFGHIIMCPLGASADGWGITSSARIPGEASLGVGSSALSYVCYGVTRGRWVAGRSEEARNRRGGEKRGRNGYRAASEVQLALFTSSPPPFLLFSSWSDPRLSCPLKGEVRGHGSLDWRGGNRQARSPEMSIFFRFSEAVSAGMAPVKSTFLRWIFFFSPGRCIKQGADTLYLSFPVLRW